MEIQTVGVLLSEQNVQTSVENTDCSLQTDGPGIDTQESQTDIWEENKPQTVEFGVQVKPSRVSEGLQTNIKPLTKSIELQASILPKTKS